ncbi:polysaccharide pyruvyl transferase family protein [Acinetobacter puyangensis]|uniref:Pyruvyltransferase n=1 Tax=Acinetobacter puyangensis TaxID=1096779 RepID=A0A240E6N0_9GAMM|nr:polysaccharide pyruvyl transferase family protein [Acinetobacter puyangensis]SNX44407.1 pyruvyltransferase [Acinetobacter puyangensis]
MVFNLMQSAFNKRIFGWKRGDNQPNVGDELAIKIVKEILAFRDINENFFRNRKGKLLSIGSVMHFAKNGDVIWGTGVNGKVNENLHTFSRLDVRAVRGPRTAKFLKERGITVKEVYGDPALLTPLFFPKEAFVENEPERDFIIIPHMSEMAEFSKSYSEEVLCSPLQLSYPFLKKLLSAKQVYSSSLHGIILAEAYGIPVVWLQSANGEDDFKYHDYYEGTGRFSYEETFVFEKFKCIRYSEIKDLYSIQKDLLTVFPYDFWDNA